MDSVSRVMDMMENLPDPLVYSIIALFTTGAVYSSIHHAKNWRPRKAKRVKLKGADGKKIEDSLTSSSLGALAQSTNYNVAFAAKKILVERAFAAPCKWSLLSRLESLNPTTRIEALVTLRYMFDFKHKSRNFLDGNNAMLEVIEFAISHHLSFLMCLHRSIDDPVATRLVIQHITTFMRSHKGCRQHYVRAISCTEWCRNPNNPLYSLETVEGIVIVDQEDSTGDIFLPEVQQFIYYMGEKNWPLNEDEHPARVLDRFRKIWGRKTDDRTSALPFHDPVERWFSDRESDHSDGDDRDDGTDDEGSGTYERIDEIMRSQLLRDENSAGLIEDDNELLDDEPDVITMADVVASFNAAEEAGLRSQDRRRNARRLMEQQNQEQME